MPPKKNIYKYPVQFVPRSCGDPLRDDPSESKNVMVPLEPENWKFGIYYDDGYDYDQHLVSIDDFNDESRELPQINTEKRVNLHRTECFKYATVINEFEINDQHDVTADINLIDNIDDIREIERRYDDDAVAKLRASAKKELDDDVLFALNNAKEADELSADDVFDDNFIELADQAPTKLKCDSDMMSLFFDTKMSGSENDDDDDDLTDDEENALGFGGGLGETIDEISQMHADYRDMKKMKLSDNRSTASTVSLAFMNSLDRHQEKKDKQSKVKFIQPIDEDLKKFVIFEDQEYNEAEVDAAVDNWMGEIKEAPSSNMGWVGKVSKIEPKMVTVPKMTKRKAVVDADCESMDTDSVSTVEHRSDELVLPNAALFHVPRPKGETTEEKKARKKGIKIAKRQRMEMKKEIRNVYAALS